MTILLILAFVAASAGVASATIKLVQTKDLNSMIPQTCRDALTADVNCSAEVTVSLDPLEAAQTAFMVGEDVLDKICSTECQDSLNAWVDGVRHECSDTGIYQILGLAVIPIYFAGGQLWLHNMMCMKDDNGYCFTQPFTIFTQGCNDCRYQFAANARSFELAEPLFPEDKYSSMLEECSVTSELTATTIYVSPLPAEATATIVTDPAGAETTASGISGSTTSTGSAASEATSTGGASADTKFTTAGETRLSVGFAPLVAGVLGALIL